MNKDLEGNSIYENQPNSPKQVIKTEEKVEESKDETVDVAIRNIVKTFDGNEIAILLK